MRVGQNPEKQNPTLQQKYLHRIIMPVYIPNLTDYFADSLKILRASLDSIRATLPAKTALTVINNNCCAEVDSLLKEYYKSGLIETLISNSENRGKIDPLIAAVRGSYEPIITLTDADVLFLEGWFEEAIKIMTAFPSTGMVGYSPDPIKWLGFTDTTLLYALFTGKTKKVFVDASDRNKFALSIGIQPDVYYSGINRGQLTAITNKGTSASLGCHHFACTVRRSFLEAVPQSPSLQKITGNSELHYIDKPVDKLGFLKLSTVTDKVYHMGNHWEGWFDKEMTPKRDSNREWQLPQEKRSITWIPYWLKNKLVTLFFRTSFYKVVKKISHF